MPQKILHMHRYHQIGTYQLVAEASNLLGEVQKRAVEVIVHTCVPKIGIGLVSNLTY